MPGIGGLDQMGEEYAPHLYENKAYKKKTGKEPPFKRGDAVFLLGKDRKNVGKAPCRVMETSPLSSRAMLRWGDDNNNALTWEPFEDLVAEAAMTNKVSTQHEVFALGALVKLAAFVSPEDPLFFNYGVVSELAPLDGFSMCRVAVPDQRAAYWYPPWKLVSVPAEEPPEKSIGALAEIQRGVTLSAPVRMQAPYGTALPVPSLAGAEGLCRDVKVTHIKLPGLVGTVEMEVGEKVTVRWSDGSATTVLRSDLVKIPEAEYLARNPPGLDTVVKAFEGFCDLFLAYVESLKNDGK